ncbi:hypothetical protein GGR57DRAFT_245112 [Xylariaceae sp. FL1272]|nr:hypothetical protein GGR57DRAFT_245112 [Xylariaceae sp. FL1272]
MESYFRQHSTWPSDNRDSRASPRSEADETAREKADIVHETPDTPSAESHQSSKGSIESEDSRPLSPTRSEKSAQEDDLVSLRDRADTEESTSPHVNETDLNSNAIAKSQTIILDGSSSGQESDQVSFSDEEYCSEEEVGIEEGANDYDEDTKSPIAEDIVLDQPYALLARFSRTLDVQESNSITISDDFSHAAKVEERQLLALRTTKDPTPPPIAQSHALQDYQMQVMLLEQDNKKKLMMAQNSFDASASHPKPSLKNPQLLVSGGTSLQDATYQDDSRKRLHSQLQLGNEILDLDVEELQCYITRLEQRAKDLGATADSKPQPALNYQTLYRILDWDKNSKSSREARITDRVLSAPFFDPPEWIGSNHDGTLRCQVPVNNFDLFLERNKNISFVVFKTYVAPVPTQLKNLAGSDSKPVIKVDESIKPIHQELIEAVETLLTSKEKYEDLWRTFKSSGELLAPYLFVYHQRTDWGDIRDSMATSLQEKMVMLWDYAIQSHGDIFAAADACISEGKINAKYVQYLFKPGDMLVQKKGDTYLGWVSTTSARLEDTYQTTRRQLVDMNFGPAQIPRYGTKDASSKLTNEKVWAQRWSISAWHWEFDGNFQTRNGHLHFNVEAGTIMNPQVSRNTKLMDHDSDTENETMPIQDLSVYPLRFAPEDIVNQLRARGKTFWKCRNRGFVSYEENTMDQETKIDERYMIDLKAYRSLHKNNQYEVAGFRNGLVDQLGPEAMDRDEPPDEKFEFLLPATIKGFNMRRKKWYDLVPERVKDVEWNKEAFQKVVMNSKAKDLIQALVSNQLAVEASTPGTDLIEGKGNGLILLLHGSPGTGKTLTAESVAEIAEKPLYRVTCADIGTKAEDAEKYLESILHLGKLWRCVVLLDEADVFLEQRSLEDLERNALVSAFLRILEYYEGILILTTNRVGTFDEAFKSRIQLALHYPTLGPYQRLQIWQNFLDRFEKLQDDTVETGDLRDNLDELCKEDMNGRQIRNALTTARQYAKWKGERLNYAKLKDVIEVAGRFDKYLVKLHKGLTHDQLAQDEGLR